MKYNTLTTPQKQQIVKLLEDGWSRNKIAKELNVAWKQVDYWSKNRARVSELVDDSDLKSLAVKRVGSSPTSRTSFSYLMGMYLGDGYLYKQGPYTWKLRLACDRKYPSIINEIQQCLTNLHLSPSICNQQHIDEVYCHGKLLPEMFPTFDGPKHKNALTLTDWQRAVIDEHPQSFIRGLFHADGSRYIHKQGQYQYVKYNLTNRSKDLVDLFCSACDTVGIEYKVHPRPFINKSGDKHVGWTVTIGKRSEVVKCEQFLGIKR